MERCVFLSGIIKKQHPGKNAERKGKTSTFWEPILKQNEQKRHSDFPDWILASALIDSALATSQSGKSPVAMPGKSPGHILRCFPVIFFRFFRGIMSQCVIWKRRNKRETATFWEPILKQNEKKAQRVRWLSKWHADWQLASALIKSALATSLSGKSPAAISGKSPGHISRWFPVSFFRFFSRN